MDTNILSAIAPKLEPQFMNNYFWRDRYSILKIFMKYFL
jgi:hypothetical protein